MTGSIWKVECAPGSEVEADTVLMVLESMKMEFPVEAEQPGVVKALHCEEGQHVTEGHLLAEIE
ncbi:MAG: acetyl-CoA carboxylase biotin carboxyl carrier protein subunit [Thermoleophilaceae bacterium]